MFRLARARRNGPMGVLLNANFCHKLYALYADRKRERERERERERGRKRGTRICPRGRRRRRLGGSEKGGSYRDSGIGKEGGMPREWEGAERVKEERGDAEGAGGRTARPEGEGGGWFQLGGSNSPGHCSFHSRFVFPVCLFPSHLR